MLSSCDSNLDVVDLNFETKKVEFRSIIDRQIIESKRLEETMLLLIF